MSQPEWREALRLKLEEVVDGFVVDGVKQEDVFDAIVEEVRGLRSALALDPAPAEDSSIVDDPGKDRPAAGN